MTDEEYLDHLFASTSSLPSHDSFNYCASCEELIVYLCNNEFVRSIAIFREKEGIAKSLHESVAELKRCKRSGYAEYDRIGKCTLCDGDRLLSGFLHESRSKGQCEPGETFACCQQLRCQR